MGKQPKSRSKAKKKPARATKKSPQSQSRDVPLDQQMVSLLKAQREAFREKFGRDPEGDDPVFFDPDCDVPAPLMQDKMQQQMVYAMQRAGIAPELIHAYRRTGRLVTNQNQHQLSEEDIEEWNAAVAEYGEWQRMAEEALRSGAHPAIAYAISKTGKLMPEDVQLTTDGKHVIASDEDADWLEAFNEYAELHPESMTDERKGTRAPAKDDMH